MILRSIIEYTTAAQLISLLECHGFVYYDEDVEKTKKLNLVRFVKTVGNDSVFWIAFFDSDRNVFCVSELTVTFADGSKTVQAAPSNVQFASKHVAMDLDLMGVYSTFAKLIR